MRPEKAGAASAISETGGDLGIALGVATLGSLGTAIYHGQTGLHVLVPMGPGVNYDTAKLLVELLGRLVTDKNPTIATMERRVRERGSRVYVDTGQTGPSRTNARGSPCRPCREPCAPRARPASRPGTSSPRRNTHRW